MNRPALTALLALAFLTCSAQAQTIVKREPAPGALKEGQVLLVDDGTCPKGQIKELTGGNNPEGGGTKQIKRLTRCIPR